MLTHLIDGFTAVTVLAGLASAGFWWWSAHLQAGRTIGSNPALIKLDRSIVWMNAWAAALTGLSVAAQAFATILERVAAP